MHVFTAEITKKLPIFMLIAVLIMLAIVGSMPSSSVSAFPQSGNAFYGSATDLEGGSVPYDPAAPTDPTLTTMIYARDVSRSLNFDGFDAFSSGEYFGRPVTVDSLDATRYGYSPQAFYFPAYDTADPSSGAHNGDEIEFYICPPGFEMPGVLVTEDGSPDGSPLRAVFEIGGLTELNLSADVVPPVPEVVSPLDGAVDVLKDAPITILFDEEISLEVLTAFHIAGSTSGDLLSGAPSLDGRTVTLPHLDFDDFGETVTVTIDAGAVSDGVGNLNAAYSWSFTTYPYFFTISGNAGMEGVALGYGEGLSVTAGLGGVYSLVVENGWTGTVTPELEGYTFEPAFRSYTNVTENQSGQDYNYTADVEAYLIYFPLFVH